MPEQHMSNNIDWQAIEKEVLARLKPFQRRTVEWAFECLFPADGRPCSGRFLVADEVGLGKTMVARGVLAKTLRHLQGRVGRVDVVYICSNADIAQQNIRRLSIPALEQLGFRSQGRLTLMPLIPRGPDGQPERDSALPSTGVNFQALTPGTSLDFRNDPGQALERALLAQMVSDILPQVRMTKWRNLFAQQVGNERFRALIKQVCTRYAIDQKLQRAFADRLREEKNGLALVDRLIDLADRFPRARKHRSSDPDQREAATLIADLRRTLAGVCIEALEPDLLILDEFQRFSHLLDSHDPNAELARQLYESQTGEGHTRVLMLSATPYRMSSVGESSEETSHHDEFIAMVKFLLRDDEATLTRLRGLLERYNDGLRTIDPANTASLEALRDQIEALLRGVMARTDRTPTSAERDAMVHAPSTPVYPDAAQMVTYAGLQRVATALQVPDLLEYWRSAPAPLSFLSGYKLRENLTEALGAEDETLIAALKTPGLFLDTAGAPGPESGHARTAALAQALIDAGQHRIAWLPPSRPSYVLGGPFAALGDSARTKRILFSSWRMVPRAVSTVLDGLLVAAQQNEFGLPSAWRHVEAEGDYMLGYPSAVLADLGHPDQWAAACDAEGLTPTVELLITRLAPAVQKLVDEVEALYGGVTQGAEDRNWYWMGPALADAMAWGRLRSKQNEGAFQPFELQALEAERDAEPLWSRELMAERRKRWDALRRGDARLGKRPADLVPTLCRLALAGPAVCALRALADDPSQHWSEAHRQTASGVAAALLHYLSHEQTVQMLAGLYPEDRSFATRVLSHSADGNLQAVLDEYLAVLEMDQSLGTDKPAGSLAALAERLTQMEVALKLKPAVLRPEVMGQDERGAWCLKPQTRSLRIARPLLEGNGDGDKTDVPTTMTQMRNAFNSPFFPFVLSSTSIGQEGLDFHWYSHVIIHWNLPASPVDFEQRDGRIHRFRNHAVRRNIARDWGSASQREAPGCKAWAWMFEAANIAVEATGRDADGIRPAWVYREGDSVAPQPPATWMLKSMGAPARIEREVPMIPHSKDEARLQRMQKMVGMYRMVFAQPRQDDLLAHLLHINSVASSDLAEKLVIDLRPPEANPAPTGSNLRRPHRS